MNSKKKKQFLKIPKLEGGNLDLKKFVEENLIYPEEALKNNIEGVVHLSYTVDDSGKILNVKVEKGLGYGCDEEAIRLIKLQSFSKVNNKGVRVRIAQKARIAFKIKPSQKGTVVNYTIVQNAASDSQNKNSMIYTYSIKSD